MTQYVCDECKAVTHMMRECFSFPCIYRGYARCKRGRMMNVRAALVEAL